MRTRLALVGLLLTAAPLAAQERRTHEVRRGDTLWDLAGHYYGDPFLWPCIHQANTGLVANPHLILPSWNLTVPAPGADCREAGVVAQAVPPPRGAMARTVFYGTGDEGDDDVELDEAALRPFVSAREFLAAPWLSGAALPPERATVLETMGREAAARLPETAHPHETVYLSGTAGAPAIGDRLLIVRFGRRVPGHGVIVTPRAVVAITAVDGTVWTGRIIAQFDEVREGDVATDLAVAPDLGAARPAAVQDGPTGRLLAFAREHPLPGSPEIGFVDLGAAAGVGDVVGLILPPRAADADPTQTLPAELVAEAVVVRVHGPSATIRVLDVAEPVLAPGMIAQVVRRMP
jgi:hypothetical protein